MKVANILTGLRIALMPVLFGLLFARHGLAALAVFLFAGLTDICDGYLARRLGQSSRFGAFFDLLADRILTLTVSAGLMISGQAGLWVAGGMWILIGRDFLVAGLNEALPGRLDIRMSWAERLKVALQFLGFGALMIGYGRPFGELNQAPFVLGGTVALLGSAGLCFLTVLDYLNRARKAF